MNKKQIEGLAALCVRKGIHYTELLPVVENYYKNRCMKASNTTPQGALAAVRSKLWQEYPQGYM